MTDLSKAKAIAAVYRPASQLTMEKSAGASEPPGT